jgi:ferritin-like metal-binding protein YciE
MLFERLNSPEEAFQFKLGAALTMERKLVDTLDDSADEAEDERVAQMFRQHREETRGHVRNIEEAFGAMGWEVDDSPCPTVKALDKEAKANAKAADDSIVDMILLQGAVEAEHHEIAVYENLITSARAMGRDNVVSILERNMQDEQRTLEMARTAEEQIAGALLHHPSRA